MEEIAATLGDGTNAFLLLFISPRHDPEEVIAGLDRHFPGLPHAGCSTAGEIGPEGVGSESIVALAFPAPDFRIAAVPLPCPADLRVESGIELIGELRGRLRRPAESGNGGLFALTLLDGLGRREEAILGALQQGLGDIPLIGGSAGDDLALRDTFVIHDRQLRRGAGVLLLAHTTTPFRVFQCNHFEPTARRMVVTACDAERRIVTELDAEPAAAAFAAAVGIDPRALCSTSFAAHPVLVRVGGEYYCRSIQKMNADGSLSFYCAIDTGVVLTVARTGNMVESLREALQGLDRALGGVGCVIGFDCIHRRLEAESRNVLPQISQLFRQFRVVGFNSYGEQFNAMHLNSTFTGIAFAAGNAP